MGKTQPAQALKIEGITFDYGKKRALSNISFDIAPEETVVLLGPNGAGKTTLFSLICGLFSPREGSIVIDGIDARSRPSEALAALGVVFQAQTLDLDLTVRQNLRYFCALRGIDRERTDDFIQTELIRLEMTGRIDEKVRALNGGHRRRVEIARAALQKPSLLLLDEPTVGLDIPTRMALIDHLHDRPGMERTALLWATHLIDEVRETDRVLVLHEGQLVADGQPADIARTAEEKDLASAFASLTQRKEAA